MCGEVHEGESRKSSKTLEELKVSKFGKPLTNQNLTAEHIVYYLPKLCNQRISNSGAEKHAHISKWEEVLHEHHIQCI